MPNTQDSDLVPIGIGQKKYDQFLSKMTEIGDNDMVFRSNCKFCGHPARIEAEQKWERSGGSYAAVERFFEDYHKHHPEFPSLSYTNIRGHIDHHYKQQIRRLRMREYADHLKGMMQERIDQMEMLDALSYSLQMKFYDLASDEEMESAKQADAQGKLAKILIDIVKLKAELTGDLKPINLFAEKVFNIWSSAVQSETDPTIKRKFLEVLNTLEAEVENAQM